MEKIEILNKESLLDKMKTYYKKLNHYELDSEKFELKPYMTKLDMNQARLKFRIRSCMTRTVKMNFASDPGYKNQLWSCSHCPNVEMNNSIIYMMDTPSSSMNLSTWTLMIIT